MNSLNTKDVRKVKVYGFIIFLVLAIAYFLVFFHRMSVGVIKDELTQAFGINATMFATLGSMYFYAYTIMQIPSGILADTLGPKKTVTISTLVTAIGCVLFGSAPSLPLAMIGRIIVGIGVSSVFVATMKILSMWFVSSKFGTMSGLTSFIGNMGSVAAQTPLALLVLAIGWRSSFYVFAGVSIAITLLCIFVVRNSPTDMNLPSIAMIEGAQPKAKPEKIKVGASLKRIITNKTGWPVILMQGLAMGAFLSFSGTWGVSYIRDVYAMDNINASTFILYFALGMALGCLVIGIISDKLKNRKTILTILQGLTLGFWVLLTYCSNFIAQSGLLGVIMFVMGFTSSGLVLCFSIFKELNDSKCVGMSISIINTFCFLVSAILPTIIGSIIDAQPPAAAAPQIYASAFTILVVLSAVSFIAALFTKETHCKNIYEEL